MSSPLVTFNDSDHSYKSKRKKLTSVSSLYGNYHEKFDEDFIAKRSAIKANFPEEYARLKKIVKWDNPVLVTLFEDQKTLEELAAKEKLKWFNKREMGTAFHKKQELEDIEVGRAVNEFDGTVFITQEYKKTFDNQSICDNLYELPDGYYPELLIFNLKYGIAGQEDRVFIRTINGIRYAWLGDWKTDELVEFEPNFFSKRFYDPISHLFDTKGVQYTLKGSTYAWMLEEFGFKIAGISITNVKISDDLEIIKRITHKVPYLKREVIDVVNHWKSTS